MKSEAKKSEAKTARLQINADFPGKGMKGDVITVPVSQTGILKDQYWRRRLKDAETDDCVKILKSDKPATTKSKTAIPEADAKGVTDATKS